MKIMVIDTSTGRLEVAVDNNKVPALANVLEASATVNSFYVEGLNAKSQQNAYGCGGFTKWINPLHR